VRSFGRAITQLTQGALDEQWVDDFLASVPRDTAAARTGQLGGLELVSRLAEPDLEVLLGCHMSCMMWTREGFEDAVAAVPHARTVECDVVPLADEGFAAAVRELCADALG
jgi:hypothetical protein